MSGKSSDFIKNKKLFSLFVYVKVNREDSEFYKSIYNIRGFLNVNFEVSLLFKKDTNHISISGSISRLELDVYHMRENNNFTYENLKEFIAYLKALPDIISYKIILSEKTTFQVYSKICIYDASRDRCFVDSIIGKFFSKTLSRYDDRFLKINAINCTNLNDDSRTDKYDCYLSESIQENNFEIDYEIYLKIAEFIEKHYDGHNFELIFN
jgi:hypothetical protein